MRFVPERGFAVVRLAGHAARRHLYAYLVLTLISGLVPVAAAWLTRLVVDDVVAGTDGARLLRHAGALAAAGAVAAVLPQAAHYLRAELDRRAGRLAQKRLLDTVNTFVGLRRFENPRFLDRLRMAETTGDMTCGDVIDGSLGVVRAVLTVVGFLGSLLLLSPVMTGLLLAGGIPTVVAELTLSRRRARLLWVIGAAQRREAFYARMLSSVGAAKEVRLFGAGGYLRRRILADRRTADTAKRRADREQVLTQTALATLAALVAGGGLLWAAWTARQGRISAGDVVVFVAAVAGVQAALASIAGDLARAHYALQMFDHYATVTGAGPDLPVGTSLVGPLRRGIELRDVWFRYEEGLPWALRGVTLTIPYGGSLALVGRNGSGKSTLVKLLCRFYDPTRGAILWDGVDLRDIEPDALRRRIGAVFQDYVEYDLTAAENIALSDVDSGGDLGRIRAAAERAGVGDVLSTLPQGYDTLLSRVFMTDGDTGTALSGGQWQRLALARALFRAPRDLMILDEPSSGLDAQAEHEVHEVIRRTAADGTCLLVSHRLGAVREADRIVVLDAGRVAEDGDHQSLMAAGAAYAEMFRLQAAGYTAA